MPQDPYGYTPAAPALTAGGGSASTAMWLGVASSTLASVGFCFCYMPFVLALPAGIGAVWYGSRSLSSAPPDDTSARSMATAGVISGLVGALVSGAILAFILLYMMLYFVIAIVAVVMGAAQH